MVVIDASAVVTLIDGGPAGERVADRIDGHALAAPYLVDQEVMHVVRRRVLGGATTPDLGRLALDRFARLPIHRLATEPVAGRVWELRDTATVYDAIYLPSPKRSTPRSSPSTPDSPARTAATRPWRSSPSPGRPRRGRLPPCGGGRRPRPAPGCCGRPPPRRGHHRCSDAAHRHRRGEPCRPNELRAAPGHRGGGPLPARRTGARPHAVRGGIVGPRPSADGAARISPGGRRFRTGMSIRCPGQPEREPCAQRRWSQS